MNIANWTPTKNNRLCSKHFDAKSFYRIGEKNRLLDDAVPTLFPELPKYMQIICQSSKEGAKRSHEQAISIDLISVASTSSSGPNLQTENPDTPRKQRLKRKLFSQVVKNREKSRKIKILQEKVKQLKNRVISLKHIC